ncbi:DnaJ domain-containing protein [Spirulina subsalsa FACHB-351]|uniref:DnaJ domain-containing protein n=1 Tax=Spirulina subsalsa FACHB-351 TaxID=234711 RepID=A0ABT3L1W4_9CYAN|nr:J domain-containing protein [Spirulina subsalsa]MCW6035460.1 DnaJ domain-containing protein [Spirulina subsalsa FACHB-351]
MSDYNPYKVLGLSPHASQGDIKRAYRRLVKQYHPDSQHERANHEKIVQLNAAYEVLGDPQQRSVYDQQQTVVQSQRQRRSKASQEEYQTTQETGRDRDLHFVRWCQGVYQPVNLLISQILNPLEAQIEQLAADPFDDELMSLFQNYLYNCRQDLNQAQSLFVSQPNPAKVAGVAANLYYCLNHISDALEELEWFTLNYDDHYLATGKELFRRARRLREEAQCSVSHFS